MKINISKEWFESRILDEEGLSIEARSPAFFNFNRKSKIKNYGELKELDVKITQEINKKNIELKNNKTIINYNVLNDIKFR